MENETNHTEVKRLIVAVDGLFKAIELHKRQAEYFYTLFNKLSAGNIERGGDLLDYSPMMSYYQQLAQWHATCYLVAERKMKDFEDFSCKTLSE